MCHHAEQLVDNGMRYILYQYWESSVLLPYEKNLGGGKYSNWIHRWAEGGGCHPIQNIKYQPPLHHPYLLATYRIHLTPPQPHPKFFGYASK